MHSNQVSNIISGLEGISADPALVAGVIVTMEDGTSYAMHHIVNIWRGELGWDRSDLDLGGQTITGLRYLLKDGSIQDYAVEIKILPAYTGELTGSVNADRDTFVLNGSLDDLTDAELTVVCTVGSGKGVPSDIVFSGAAGNDPVNLDTDMIAELVAAGEENADVNISATVSSSNYATVIVPVE